MKPKLKKRNWRDPNQPELVGLIWMPKQHQFRLRVGDVVRLDKRLCRVIRVNECAAVLLMRQPARQFKTRFDRPVRFERPPALVRIWSNSDIEILNRKERSFK